MQAEKQSRKSGSVSNALLRGGNYRWEQCYELGRRKLWAIVDDESAANRSVTSHLLVVNHQWADSIGRPFEDCELPQRIIALLNQDDGHWDRAVSVMRTYKAPPNNKPYSDEGLRDLQRQCLDAASSGDSSLLEMAGLAIKRLLDEKDESRPST